MTRSYKKPYTWVAKKSTALDKRAFRHSERQACHELEVDFDPDRDFEEFHAKDKAGSEWGTKCGWDLKPKESDDTWVHEDYIKSQRK